MRKSYVSELTESSSEVSDSCYSMSDSIMLRSSFEATRTSSKASAGFCTKAIVFLLYIYNGTICVILCPVPEPTSVSDYLMVPMSAATLMLSILGESSLLSLLLIAVLFFPSAGEMVFLRVMDCFEFERLLGSISGPKRFSCSFCRHSTVTSIAT